MPSHFPVSGEDLAWLCFLSSLSELQNIPWRRAWKEGLLFTRHVLCARQCAQGNRVRMIGLIPQQKTVLLMYWHKLHQCGDKCFYLLLPHAESKGKGEPDLRLFKIMLKKGCMS